MDGSRLDVNGIYKCFGNTDVSNSLLNQVKESCNKVLGVIYKTNDVANIPSVYNKCSQFFRNNIANQVRDIKSNISKILSENQNIYNAIVAGLDLGNNKKCPVDSHVKTPILEDATDQINAYNDKLLPELDAFVRELTQIKNTLPNYLIIDDPIIGHPSSNPFIKIGSNYIFEKDNDVKNGKYVQNISFSIPRGNPGPMGSPGMPSLPGASVDSSITGISGKPGVWEIPVQYQGIF
jgi:hypothetical protein